MLDESISATAQLDTGFLSLGKFTRYQEYIRVVRPNISESVEQDKGTWHMLNRRTYHENIRKYIKKDFIVQQEDSEKYSAHWLVTELPVADVDIVSFTDFPTYWHLVQRYIGTQSKLIRAFYPTCLITNSLTTEKDSEHNLKNDILAELSERFAVIAKREDNWDGRESKKPSVLALSNARAIMDKFFDVVISEGYACDTPLTSSDQDGYITFAWYGEVRKLHLKIEDDEAVYVKVWRQNGEIKLSLETLHSKDYLTIWEWFLYG